LRFLTYFVPTFLALSSAFLASSINVCAEACASSSAFLSSSCVTSATAASPLSKSELIMSRICFSSSVSSVSFFFSSVSVFFSAGFVISAAVISSTESFFQAINSDASSAKDVGASLTLESTGELSIKNLFLNSSFPIIAVPCLERPIKV
jgi:hypothetical protein